jgi:hypothetical protein
MDARPERVNITHAWSYAPEYLLRISFEGYVQLLLLPYQSLQLPGFLTRTSRQIVWFLASVTAFMGRQEVSIPRRGSTFRQNVQIDNSAQIQSPPPVIVV